MEGTFAPSGTAATWADCSPSSFVSVIIQVEALPSVATQPTLLQAIASAASVPADSVLLVGATAGAGNSSIVQIHIATGGIAQARTVCSNLESTQLHLALALPGLPVCRLMSCDTVGQPPGTWNENFTAVMVGVTACVFFCTISIGIIYKHQSNKESDMLKATKELRRRLKIEPGDGYILDSDWIYPWQKITNAMHLHHNFIESATKLSLLRDFNPLEFDAFCVCLIRPAQQLTGKSLQNIALYDWNLEIGKWLLQPSIKSDKSTINTETGREWTQRDRYAYLQKLLKCQVRRCRH
jgi:hypothetical protein